MPLPLIQGDPYLEPYTEAIEGRHSHFLYRLNQLTQSSGDLSTFADGYMWYGLHLRGHEWVLREWAPNATKIYLVGDHSDWRELPEYELQRINDHGDWEIKLPKATLRHQGLYKLKVYWPSGEGERIPAWCTRVVQDEQTKIFSAQVWCPAHPYCLKIHDFKPHRSPLLIYECHIGMAQDKEGVGTYEEFRVNTLPRIQRAGYNCIQIMAIQEHPYYGSFGYHVSSLYAPSSRFGTPDELRHLVDDAHRMGISVIMDLVHSHAVKNELEGLGNYCGDPGQYFLKGPRRHHEQWDSLCWDYGKDEVVHFLLSNCKYWLEEFGFDGFRFDGVTSMIYYSHGMGESFTGYDDYYNGHQDDEAICYLTLANQLIHQVKPQAVTIAEEVSGMPGLAYPIAGGGYGFDYRMAMNIPDYWIRMLKEKRDEDWNPLDMLYNLTNRRQDELTVSYVESHDQALVGDKTVIFRLVDASMYWHFRIGDEDDAARRGIALHKMIRLLTLSTISGAYLNFMGNEWGHPEWIDFPREGNSWSYKYARRQWHLVDDPTLCYHYLGDFDRKMISTIKLVPRFQSTRVQNIWYDEACQILVIMRGRLLFVFNFSPSQSLADYQFIAPSGKYTLVLDTDDTAFGGQRLIDPKVDHFTESDKNLPAHKGHLSLYIPARSAQVYRLEKGGK